MKLYRRLPPVDALARMLPIDIAGFSSSPLSPPSSTDLDQINPLESYNAPGSFARFVFSLCRMCPILARGVHSAAPRVTRIHLTNYPLFPRARSHEAPSTHVTPPPLVQNHHLAITNDNAIVADRITLHFI